MVINYNSWEEQRKVGLFKFILKEYVLKIGLPLAVGMSILFPLINGKGWHYFLTSDFPSQLIGTIIIYMILFFLFGLIYWFIRELIYKIRIKSKT
jgi:hypothetical protein